MTYTMQALWRRLRNETRGATVVEFAFVLTPLLIVIMGGLDLGYQAYVRAVLQGALYDVSRTGSLEAPNFQCQGSSIEVMVGCAIQRRSDVVARDATYEIDIKSYYDFTGVGRSEKLVTDYNKNGKYDAGDCFSDLNENGRFDEEAGRTGIGGADDVVFYEITLTMPRLFPMHGLMNWSPNYTIKAEAAVRNQPFTRQKIPPTVCV